MSIWKHPDPGETTMTIMVNGQATLAYPGETVATVLLRLGHRAFGNSPVTGKPLAPTCMMGVCFGCLCSIDGRAGSQACLELVRDGLIVNTETAVTE